MTATITSPTDIALWETLLWCSTDDDGQPLDRDFDISDVDPAAVEQLSKQFWAWNDQAGEAMIHHGFGDLSLEDLLGADRVEHCYVLVRDGHGVGMADNWTTGSREWFCCRELERLARAQGEIGVYVGYDNRVYL